jgi:hypothetical protein
MSFPVHVLSFLSINITITSMAVGYRFEPLPFQWKSLSEVCPGRERRGGGGHPSGFSVVFRVFFYCWHVLAYLCLVGLRFAAYARTHLIRSPLEVPLFSGNGSSAATFGLLPSCMWQIVDGQSQNNQVIKLRISDMSHISLVLRVLEVS